MGKKELELTRADLAECKTELREALAALRQSSDEALQAEKRFEDEIVGLRGLLIRVADIIERGASPEESKSIVAEVEDMAESALANNGIPGNAMDVESAVMFLGCDASRAKRVLMGMQKKGLAERLEGQGVAWRIVMPRTRRG